MHIYIEARIPKIMPITTITSPPQKRIKHNWGQNNKVSVLPINVETILGSISVECLLLRGSTFPKYLNDDGTMHYEGMYSTLVASTSGIGGILEYEHEGSFSIIKNGITYFTVFTSHCPTHLAQLIHTANHFNYSKPAINSDAYKQQHPAQTHLHIAYRDFHVEPIQILDPKHVESVNLDTIILDKRDLSMDDKTDLIHCAIEANNNDPCAQQIVQTYGKLLFKKCANINRSDELSIERYDIIPDTLRKLPLYIHGMSEEELIR